MEGLELISFQIISSVGMARSSYIEAIKEARNGNFDIANEKIKEGEEYFIKGHSAHAELIQQEAGGSPVQPSLLLLHAEDQLMSAETIKIIAEELIINYKRISNLENA
ncbi:PTS lactose/cellobiose transporter subunit IIA [Erysipelotrichaceae bacterium HCN-30851]